MGFFYKILAFFHIISPPEKALIEFNQHLVRSHQNCPAFKKVKEIESLKTVSELEECFDTEWSKDNPSSLILRRIIIHPAFQEEIISSVPVVLESLPFNCRYIIENRETIQQDYNEWKRNRTLTQNFIQSPINIKEELEHTLQKVRARTCTSNPYPANASFVSVVAPPNIIKNNYVDTIGNEIYLRNRLKEKIPQANLTNDRYKRIIDALYWKFWRRLVPGNVRASCKEFHEIVEQSITPLSSPQDSPPSSLYSSPERSPSNSPPSSPNDSPPDSPR